MAENKTRGRSTDRKRLNKSEPYEVAYAKSDRASPARKALLGSGGDSAGGGRARKSAGKKATKRAATKSGSARSGAAKRSSGSSSAKKSGGAKKSGAARKGSAGKSARKSSSGSARGSAKSASPAMKRTNAAGSRAQLKPTTRGTPNPPKDEKTVENTAPRTMREADAIDLLTDDHLEVSALFKRYEKLAKQEAAAEDRQTLAQSICDMLKAHTTIEEEIFYPAARSAGIEPDLLDEAKIEHQSAKDLIAQIEGGNPEDDLYDARVSVLGEYIEHHVVEEHTELFPKCRRAGMDLVTMRGELEARKMSLVPDDGSMAAAKGDGSPGLLAKLSDKLFSSDNDSDKRGRAT